MLFVVEALIVTVVLVSGVILVSYIIFEEDAFFDITDFNVLHVYLLVAALASVCSDNAAKAVWGAWLDADRGVFLYALFKAISLVLYFGVIWLVFFKHVMTPMLIDDVDDGYAFLSCADALGVSGALCITLLVTLNAAVHATSASRLRSLPIWCLTTVVGIVVASLVLVNVFYEAPSSSVAPSSRFATCPTTYTGSRFGVIGGFDWHCAKSTPVVILFIEFISQLWLLLAALVIVAISLFAIFAALFIGDIDDDASESRVASGWLRATTTTGQLLAVLIASLIVVNFAHDLFLFTIGGLSQE